MAFVDALDRAPVSLMHDENTPPNTNASSNKDTFSNTETPLLSKSPQTNIPASEPKDLPQGFERNLPPSYIVYIELQYTAISTTINIMYSLVCACVQLSANGAWL